MNMSRFLSNLSCAAAVCVMTAGAAASQSLSDNGPSSRFPATGIPILDCAPAAPAPEDSCVVRIPPNQQRGNLSRKSTGDREAEFKFVRSGDPLFPDDLDLSATVLLIDRTPTVNRSSGVSRRSTWQLERGYIKKLAESLPQDELIAIYTFDDELQRLVDFTTDRSRVVSAIENMNLEGLNTRITTSTREVVDVLAARNNLLFKNLVVITDGQEEGTADPADLSEAAEKAGVTISSLAMVWEGLGVNTISGHLDFLSKITTEDFGASRTVRLRARTESERQVDLFISDLTSSLSSSGLIVPDGEPAPAEITVPLKVPVAGVEGSFDTQRITATFTPASAETTEEEPAEEEPPAEEENLLFGYPAVYVYGLAGVLAALLLIILALVFLRRPEDRPSPAEGELELDDDDIDFDGGDDKTEVVGAVAPVERPIAYLVRKDTGDRLPVVKARTGIGRSSDNRVVINDPSVSRVHAQLHVNRDGGFSLTDLDSLNGTFVNEKKIKGTQEIKAGDTLGFGTIRANIIKA